MFIFTSAIDPNVVIYMGKDKFENEDLIKYAFPDEDIWFHVADLSSAHVYLRIPGGVKRYDDINAELIAEMC
jgi:predicted ribosome quality control (RQC) complex YloA/Tae2 family protein